MEDDREYENINRHSYDYYDEYNDNKGKGLTFKKGSTTVADTIKYNMNLEDRESENERKRKKIEEDRNYEKNKKKLEHFHIKSEDPMYNMVEDKKAKFEESKELVKMYLQALLDEYYHKQYKKKRKNSSSKSKSKEKKHNKRIKTDRYPNDSESDSDSSSSSSSD